MIEYRIIYTHTNLGFIYNISYRSLNIFKLSSITPRVLVKEGCVKVYKPQSCSKVDGWATHNRF